MHPHDGMLLAGVIGNHDATVAAAELKNIGSWWAAVQPETLPDGQLPSHVLPDFEGEWGDRRQEIIFIGVGLKPEIISAALDKCLLTDDEQEQYRTHWSKMDAQRIAVWCSICHPRFSNFVRLILFAFGAFCCREGPSPSCSSCGIRSSRRHRCTECRSCGNSWTLVRLK
eukprot:SAG31_NODE_5078_length_2756_cov_1.607452_3_plen_170_part_00